MNVVLPFLSSLISFVFALTVFDQFLSRRRSYQLVWAVGLVIYGIGTFCEFLTGILGLNATVYRLWYLAGAMYTAAWLGMGTVYLLVPRRAAHGVMVILGVASFYAAYRVFTVPVNLGMLAPGGILSGQAFLSGAGGPRILTPFFNTFGTIALVGGALYSAWVFWRKRILPHRVTSNILIAVGAFLPALGGTFARLGNPDYLYVSELAGVVVIFLGFLRSTEVFGFYRFPPFLHRLSHRGDITV